MLLRYFYDKMLSQASYMVGCTNIGEALVIDPARDITPYLQAAKEEGLRVAHVAETHIHADFVSGARELAARTGARLYLSAMGGEAWRYDFPGPNTTLLRDGDSLMLGTVRVDVIHTPGHTPEHLIFQVTDVAVADKPMGLFSGDCLFVGDVGRPDLLEETAGIADTKIQGARQQYQNVRRFKSFPDFLQIWPGHGAGSACGKALSPVPTGALGYEKLFSPAFQFDNEDKFVAWLLDGQPEVPRYFAHMKHLNQVGPTLLRHLPQPQRLGADDLHEALRSGALVIDVRRLPAYAQGHIPGTLSIPASSDRFNIYAGWFVNYDEPTYLILPETELDRVLRQLRAVGIDNIPGYFTPDVVTRPAAELSLLNAQDLAERIRYKSAVVVDVRSQNEYHEQHIPGAHNIPLGYLPEQSANLPRDVLVVTSCNVGVRSQVAASYLEMHGFTNVANLTGGIEAWKEVGLPVEEH